MSLTVEKFFRSYPEFKAGGQSAHTQLVEEKLSEALLEVDASVFGLKADLYQGLLAAQALARSPFGKNAKLSSLKGDTVYDDKIRKLLRQVWGKARPLI